MSECFDLFWVWKHADELGWLMLSFVPPLQLQNHQKKLALQKLIIGGNEQLFDLNSNVNRSSSCEAPKQGLEFSNSAAGCLILEEFQLQHLTPSLKQIVPPLKRLLMFGIQRYLERTSSFGAIPVHWSQPWIAAVSAQPNVRHSFLTFQVPLSSCV